MNPYYVPDRTIPDDVDNYDDEPFLCPVCGFEINERIYVQHGMVIGCGNCIKDYAPDEPDVRRYFD